MSQTRLRNASTGEPVTCAKVLLSPIGEPPLASRITDADGTTAWDELNPQSHIPYRLSVDVEGYEPFSQEYPSVFADIDIALTPTHEPEPPPVTLSRLVGIDSLRHRMVNELGERVYGRGASMFLLYKKYLDGLDIDPFLSQHRALGCNLGRIMGMFESLGGFNPKLYGTMYYDMIPSFMTRLERFRIYGLWTACAATGSVFNEDEAIEHIRRTVEQLVTTNGAIFSPVNEQGQHNNSINRQRAFAISKGWMLNDTGSFGSDEPCQPPFGTHVVLHCNRAYPSNVKDGCTADHPNMVNDHLEVGMDEPVRYGENGGGDGHELPHRAADAAGTAYTSLFWVFHSLQGQRGDVLTGNTLDCAVAAFDAMRGH